MASEHGDALQAHLPHVYGMERGLKDRLLAWVASVEERLEMGTIPRPGHDTPLPEGMSGADRMVLPHAPAFEPGEEFLSESALGEGRLVPRQQPTEPDRAEEK